MSFSTYLTKNHFLGKRERNSLRDISSGRDVWILKVDVDVGVLQRSAELIWYWNINMSISYTHINTRTCAHTHVRTHAQLIHYHHTDGRSTWIWFTCVSRCVVGGPRWSENKQRRRKRHLTFRHGQKIDFGQHSCVCVSVGWGSSIFSSQKVLWHVNTFSARQSKNHLAWQRQTNSQGRISLEPLHQFSISKRRYQPAQTNWIDLWTQLDRPTTNQSNKTCDVN